MKGCSAHPHPSQPPRPHERVRPRRPVGRRGRAKPGAGGASRQASVASADDATAAARHHGVGSVRAWAPPSARGSARALRSRGDRLMPRPPGLATRPRAVAIVGSTASTGDRAGCRSRSRAGTHGGTRGAATVVPGTGASTSGGVSAEPWLRATWVSGLKLSAASRPTRLGMKPKCTAHAAFERHPSGDRPFFGDRS